MFTKDFFLRHRNGKRIYTDNSKQLNLVKIYNGIMAQAPLIASTNGVAEIALRRVKKEQPLHECKVDYQKNRGTVQWSAIVTCATCTTIWPMARQHSRKDMTRNLTDHQFPSEHWLSTSQLPQKSSQEYIISSKHE